LEQARGAGLLSDEHFTVDGTLSEAGGVMASRKGTFVAGLIGTPTVREPGPPEGARRATGGGPGARRHPGDMDFLRR
jgi:hypothetical protein